MNVRRHQQNHKVVPDVNVNWFNLTLCLYWVEYQYILSKHNTLRHKIEELRFIKGLSVLYDAQCEDFYDI